MASDPVREKALADYRQKLMEHREVDSKLKELRLTLRDLNNQYEKSENDLKALQSVGQIVGEVLRQLTEEKFIVKATNGPRYVVGCRRQLEKSKLKPGTRVALDMTTLTIMRSVSVFLNLVTIAIFMLILGIFPGRSTLWCTT